MQITAKFDRERVWMRGSSVRYLVVQASAAGSRQVRQAALNLAFVVDASGSMSGEPLRCAVEAADRVVDCLSDEDRLAIVSFDSEVKTHLASELMTAEGRRRAQQELRKLHAGSNTNLSGGWFRGAEHVARCMEAACGSQNRVIVLSDGHANEGIVDPAELAEHATQLARRGLFSSTVGVGDHYHSETLEAIATHGGGVHHRAARPAEIVEVVTAELNEIRGTASEGIAIRIALPEGVRLKNLNEFPVRNQDGELLCDLGSLAEGASRTAVFRVKFPAGETGTKSGFKVSATWRQPGDEDVYSSDPVRVTALFSESKDDNAQQPDLALAETVAQVWQAYIVRRVVRLNRERRFSEAIRRLDRDLPMFMKYAKHAASGERLVAELKRLRASANREWNEANRKEVELVMHKRAYGRMDERSAPPVLAAAWSDLLPDE